MAPTFSFFLPFLFPISPFLETAMVDLLSRYLGSACQTSFLLPGVGWVTSRRSGESIPPSALIHFI